MAKVNLYYRLCAALYGKKAARTSAAADKTCQKKKEKTKAAKNAHDHAVFQRPRSRDFGVGHSTVIRPRRRILESESVAKNALKSV